MKKILHIDMDCFFAAVEERENPLLKKHPLAIGGRQDQRGVICTANYRARKYGVRSAMPTVKALELCPHLKILPPRMKLYRQASHEVFSIIEKFAHEIRIVGIDEAYLDLGEAKSATWIAQKIQNEILEKTQLKASLGAAPNMFLAKVASDWKKPFGIFVLSPQIIPEFMLTLDVKKINGVGKKTAEKLSRFGIKNCGDIQKYGCLPREHFGKFSHQLYLYAHGVDNRQVLEKSERKSLSVEHTFSEDIFHIDDLNLELSYLFEEFRQRLNKFMEKKRNIKVRKIFVKIKTDKHNVHSIEKISQYYSLANFSELFTELWDDRPLRLIGIGVKFASDKGQLSLGLLENMR